MPARPRLLLLLLACAPLAAQAQARAPAQGREQEREEEAALERRLQNPITDLMAILLLSTVEMGVGPARENRTSLNAQAQLPVRVGGSWNVLSWTQLPLFSLPPGNPGGERVNGLGDTTQYLLVEPARVRHLLWGAGPVVLLPTATQTALGSGSFALGPAGLVSYQDRHLTAALLAHYLRSVDGAAGRAEVERAFFKPVLSYVLPGGVALGLESETTLDTSLPRGERWTVPLQASVSAVTLVGPVPLNLQVGGRWYVAAPSGGPSWGLRLAISFVVAITREEAPDDGEEEGRPSSPGG